MRDAAEKKTVEAQEFILRDGKGNRQAHLVAQNDGPRLRLFDTEGRKRATLSVVGDKARFRLYGTHGTSRLEMAMAASGAYLVLPSDKQGQGVALLTIPERTQLTITDAGGVVRAECLVRSDGSALCFVGDPEVSAATFEVSPDGSVSWSIQGKKIGKGRKASTSRRRSTVPKNR